MTTLAEMIERVEALERRPPGDTIAVPNTYYINEAGETEKEGAAGPNPLVYKAGGRKSRWEQVTDTITLDWEPGTIEWEGKTLATERRTEVMETIRRATGEPILSPFLAFSGQAVVKLIGSGKGAPEPAILSVQLEIRPGLMIPISETAATQPWPSEIATIPFQAAVATTPTDTCRLLVKAENVGTGYYDFDEEESSTLEVAQIL